MDYMELLQASERFKKDPLAYDQSYFEARRNINWQNLERASIADIRNVVLCFLNKWKCRIPVTDAVAIRIQESFQLNIPFLKALRGEKLEDIDFMSMRTIENNKMSKRQIVRLVFANFSGIGQRFSNVAASKTIHMINPELFMIWDNAIGAYYGIKLNPFDYAYKFMPLMKEKANAVISSMMKDCTCSRVAAISEISSRCDGKTLAKLIDEYNWVKAHED